MRLVSDAHGTSCEDLRDALKIMVEGRSGRRRSPHPAYWELTPSETSPEDWAMAFCSSS